MYRDFYLLREFELIFCKYTIVSNAQVVLLKQKKNPMKKNSFCALLS
jgi:hypothetical protein